MALMLHPHTLTLTKPRDPDEVDAELGPIKIEIPGQFTPISSQTAFESFGVTVTNSYLFLCDKDPTGLYPSMQGEVIGKPVAIEAGPISMDLGGIADHCQILLVERDE